MMIKNYEVFIYPSYEGEKKESLGHYRGVKEDIIEYLKVIKKDNGVDNKYHFIESILRW